MVQRQEIQELLDELAEAQRARVLSLGRCVIPHLTADDVLQPNDFPELENHPHFRYEEGVLEGVLTVRAALLALLKDSP